MSLNLGWCRETAHPSYQAKWTEDNPSVGQCCVTALIVQDLYGGDIYSCKVGNCSHYFNIMSDEITLIDLTKEQFGNRPIVYKNPQFKDRRGLLRNKDIKYRYELLKSRMNNTK